MECILGIDIGTTGTKSALFTIDGVLMDSEYISYKTSYPRETWVEQNPDDWWKALIGTVRPLVSRNNDRFHVVSMSLSAQGGCLILLDEHFNPITTAVSWLDRRAQEIAEQLKKAISQEDLYKTCGWSNLDGLSFPTLFWFKEKMPEHFNRARYFASTIDYMNYLLTGNFSIDYTNLAMTMFLDLHKRDWSDNALHIAGLTRNNVPEIAPSGSLIGKLKSDAAEKLGLPEDVMVVSGAHDQYCASIGAGAIKNGDCILSCGTAWVLLVTSERLFFDKNRIIHPGIHVLDNKYGLLTTVPSGGNSLNWFQNTFQPGLSHEALSENAEKIEVGSAGLLFIPPHISKSGRCMFYNIDTAHRFGHFTRSIFEGVAYANRKRLESLSETGQEIKRIIMIGGGAKSTVWPQIVADISNLPLIIPKQKEAACAGAAILAAVGSGFFQSIEAACERFGEETYRIQPDKKNAAIYEEMYKDFITVIDNLEKL